MWGRPTRLQVTTALHVMESGPSENTTPIQLSFPDPALEWIIRSTPGTGSSREGRREGEGEGEERKHKEMREQCRHHIHALPVSQSLFTFHHNSFRYIPCC